MISKLKFMICLLSLSSLMEWLDTFWKESTLWYVAYTESSFFNVFKGRVGGKDFTVIRKKWEALTSLFSVVSNLLAKPGVCFWAPPTACTFITHPSQTPFLLPFGRVKTLPKAPGPEELKSYPEGAMFLLFAIQWSLADLLAPGLSAAFLTLREDMVGLCVLAMPDTLYFYLFIIFETLPR